MKLETMTIDELFFQLAPFLGKYQVSFQFWGNGNNNVFIMKDDVDLYDNGGLESVSAVLIDAIQYLKRINSKP